MSAVNPQMEALQARTIAEQKAAVEAALIDLRKAYFALERIDFERALTFTGANFYGAMVEKTRREGKDAEDAITVLTGRRKITIHAAEESCAELQVKIRRKLFSFSCEQDWVNRARGAYANCGVQKGFYIAIDARGHVMRMGRCFMQATKISSYPVTVYELETNWGETL